MSDRSSVSSSVSPRQRATNRRNARKSTGPRTQEGKARSSRNAVVHGLYSDCPILLPGESQALFLLQRESLLRSYEPQNAVELLLVERIALSQWKLDRLHALEFTRHQNQIGRMQRAYAFELRKAEEQLREFDPKIDFSEHYQDLPMELDDEMQKLPNHLADKEMPELQQHVRTMIGLIKQSQGKQMPVSWVQAAQVDDDKQFDKIEKLSRHEQRLENSMYRAMRELRNLRRDRERRRKNGDEEDLPPSPYRSDQTALMERVNEEAAKMRNEAKQEETDASDDEESISSEEELEIDAQEYPEGVKNRDIPPGERPQNAADSPLEAA